MHLPASFLQVSVADLLAAVSSGLRSCQCAVLLRQRSCALQGSGMEALLVGRVLGYRPLDKLCQAVCDALGQAQAQAGVQQQEQAVAVVAQ